MEQKTEVNLRTIADFEKQGTGFYIDAFQRGYRWTKLEVRDLLEDIYEFSQSDYVGHNGAASKFYCLQPIIVTKTADGSAWKVIDGQQRLTTLYLIYLYYVNSAGRRKPPLPYSLHYNGKEKLEKCLEEILEKSYIGSEDLDEPMEKYGEDIDCYYILSAYSEICDYFNRMFADPELRNRIDDMKKVFDNFMKIIWYELIDCDEATEISTFTKINMGKIPLTNAELIKALLLRSADETMTSYQENIAIKWDEIEAHLSNMGFWAFLVNNTSAYSTRIDFIFEIMAQDINEHVLKDADSEGSLEKYYIEQAYNKQYFSFYVFNNYARLLKKENPQADYVKEIWIKIDEYYQMFRDWYGRRSWYHMIGYLVTVSNSRYISRLTDIAQLYKHQPNDRGHKTSFESGLRKEIIGQLGIASQTKNDLRDFVLRLDYDKDSRTIRNILLLYNICTLELLETQTDARFPFDKFKDEKNRWDIEHINAVADDRPYDEYDREENRCKIWLENAKGLPHIDRITTPEGTNVSELIDRILAEKLYLPRIEPGTATFISVYEAIISYYSSFGDYDNNGIGNLTLLDAGTNRSYKSDVFPLKRKRILENFTKEIFVPLCTKNVFLKAFLKANDLLKWTQEDMRAYSDDIVDKIAAYLKLEEGDHDE